jgi:adenylylsulfate kinase
MNKNIFHQSGLVSPADRHQQAGHQPVILWFTGFSGAGKSTLAHAVEQSLFNLGCRTFVVDGDNVRHGLCADLGFTANDRQENIRRIGELSKLFLDAGIITLTAFISPFRADRERVRTLVKESEFIEIYCNADLAVCEQRDIKGLYKKARSGEIADFTGISSPYEPPQNPELVINTATETLENSVNIVLAYLAQRGIIRSDLIK